MPTGGFGNLIALPLQHEARQHGNTLFLDGELAPHRDQWEFLASLPRITAGDLDRVLAEARDATRSASSMPQPTSASRGARHGR